ncbi:TraR/DksA family transcriptional regulator [Rhodobacterales bacterium HKCCE3408]|nr:TraR/DksA family transcriptional regulator [Rhodobacterales bacterium HKCCE3408]
MPDTTRDTATPKTRLETRLTELRTRLKLLEHSLDQPMDRDVEERSVEREDDEMLEELGQAGLQEIEAIEAALARIEDGTYGICVSCGEQISPERLEAVPYAALCRTCAN